MRIMVFAFSIASKISPFISQSSILYYLWIIRITCSRSNQGFSIQSMIESEFTLAKSPIVFILAEVLAVSLALSESTIYRKLSFIMQKRARTFEWKGDFDSLMLYACRFKLICIESARTVSCRMYKTCAIDAFVPLFTNLKI